MPSNFPRPNTANLPTGDLIHDAAFGILGQFLGTFRGWITRYAVRLTGALTLAITTWITAKWWMLEELAAQAGASAQTLADLHAQGISLATVLAGLVASLIMAGLDILLSRIAAKVSEQPIDVHAIPTDQ